MEQLTKTEVNNLNKELLKIEKELWDHQSKLMDKYPKSYKEYHEAWCRYAESKEGSEKFSRITELQVKLINETPKELMELSTIKHGDILTMEEFLESVDSFCFIDSDGIGYLMQDGKEVSSIEISTELLRERDKLGLTLSNYSGIVWYNK